MEENKDWCSFADEAINNLNKARAKDADFNAKEQRLRVIERAAGEAPCRGARSPALAHRPETRTLLSKPSVCPALPQRQETECAPPV